MNGRHAAAEGYVRSIRQLGGGRRPLPLSSLPPPPPTANRLLATPPAELITPTCDSPRYIDTVSEMYRKRPSAANARAKPSRD